MAYQWDEFSKSLAEPVPRRESLRRLAIALGGAVLSPLGLKTAWAAGTDPSKAFCRCSNKRQQNACLAACRACNGDTSRLCGACGSYYCADLASDTNNCGACGYVCAPPGPYEYVSCIAGECLYDCVAGAVRCGGVCTSLDWDPNNCGACGNVCGGSTPYCVSGACSYCPPGAADCYGDGICRNLQEDVDNCGACGVQCGVGYWCVAGACVPAEPPPPP
jgi:hypothetical protein